MPTSNDCLSKKGITDAPRIRLQITTTCPDMNAYLINSTYISHSNHIESCIISLRQKMAKDFLNATKRSLSWTLTQFIKTSHMTKFYCRFSPNCYIMNEIVLSGPAVKDDVVNAQLRWRLKRPHNRHYQVQSCFKSDGMFFNIPHSKSQPQNIPKQTLTNWKCVTR